MQNQAYPWLLSNHQDSQIFSEYPLANLAGQVFFLQQPWLKAITQPKIVVTGAASWLGHYILHVLTANVGIGNITATDNAPRPVYLEQERYAAVRYLALSSKFKELQEVIGRIQPHLIFHCDYLWDIAIENSIVLYENNVCRTEMVCQAATQAQTRRVIVFSDASVYGVGAMPAGESDLLAPGLPIAKSFADAEQIALAYHRPEKTEIYCLRLASLYGPLIDCGIMTLAQLLHEGIMLGAPDNADRLISTLSGREMALASFLLAMAPHPGCNIFNVAEGDISLRACLKAISELMPRRKIMGIDTRLAQIMKIGYQEEISLPTELLELLGSFSFQTTNFFNQLRFNQQRALFNRRSIQYLLNLRALSNKRLQDTIGWRPSAPLTFLADTIRRMEQAGWDKALPETSQQPKLQEIHQTIEILDGVSSAVRTLMNPASDEETTATFTVPLLNFTMDFKSLRLLVDEGWNQLLYSLFHSESSEAWEHTWPLWVTSLVNQVLMLIRYEHHRAKQQFPQNRSAQIKWLTQQMGVLNLSQIRSYATTAILSHLVKACHDWCNQYAPLVGLLPDKNYGIFLGDERGDLGVVVQARNGKIEIAFPRKQIDSMAQTDYFQRRLLEFKKQSRLHLAMGVKLKRFMSDLFSGGLGKAILANWGSEYFFAEHTEYYATLGKTMQKSPRNLFLVLGSDTTVTFGIRLQANRLAMLPSSYCAMVNSLIATFGDHKDIEEMLRQASHGRETPVFLKIATAKALLDTMLSPSLIHKAVARLMQQNWEN